MNFKKILPVLAVGALLIAGAASAFSARTVSASASAAPAAAAEAAMSSVGLGRGGGPDGRVSDENLAAALGIDADKLTAAYETANAEYLKQAVAAGLLTQEQADQYSADGRTGLRGLHGTADGTIDYDAILAGALGISVEKLQAAFQAASAAGIDQAVTDGRMTQAQADLAKGQYALQNDAKFRAAMQSAYEAALKQAVTDGVITQAQADAILASHAGAGMSGFGTGFDGFGGRFDRGGESGRGGAGGGFAPGGKMDGGKGTAPDATTTVTP